MSSLVRWLVAALLGGAAAFLIACGDQGGLLSSSESSRLSDALDSVAAAVSAAHCPQADKAGQVLGDVVRELSDKVDPRLKNELKEGVATVSRLAHDDCRNAAPPTTTPTTPTDTIQTQTTAPPLTTPTATTPETIPTVPPGETTPTTPGTVTGGGGGSGGAGPTQ